MTEPTPHVSGRRLPGPEMPSKLTAIERNRVHQPISTQIAIEMLCQQHQAELRAEAEAARIQRWIAPHRHGHGRTTNLASAFWYSQE